MKRKFTNVFFLVAIAVAAMTSFVSCKDYEEDLRNEIDAKYQNLDQSLKDLRDNLEQRVSALEAFKTQQEGINADLQRQIDDLQNQINAIKQCECNLDDYLKKGDLDEYAKKAQVDALEEIVKSHTTQIEALTGQLADGLARITALEEAVAKIKSCECNLDALADRITAIENRLDGFVTEDNLKETLKDYVTRGELADSINAIRLEVVDLRSELSRVEAIAQAAYDLATKDSARIDYVINLAKNDSIEIEKIWDAIKKIEIPGAYDDTVLRGLIQSNTNRIEALEKLTAPIAGQIQDLQRQINAIKQCNCDLSNLATKDELAAVEKTANDALALAKQDSIRIDNLKGLYDILKEWADALVIPGPGTDYDDQWIKDQFASDKKRMDILGDSIAKVLAEIDPIKQSIEDLENELRAKIKEDSTYLKKLIDDIVIPDIPTPGTPYDDAWIRAFEDQLPYLSQVPTLALDISAIQGEIADLPTVRENISNLQSDLATEKERITTIGNELDELAGVVNALSEKLNKLITSIVVQDVTNPVYGTVNTPFGITSNVLITYYGNSKNPDFKFPTTIEDLYYNKNKVIEDVSVASKVTVNEGLLFENAEGNAGTVYLTVNPTNVDFSGTTFSLVNSRDEESPIKLGALQKTDRLINLGWNVTRADNGLYSATATINSDFAKAAPHIGLTEDDLKAAYQDFKAAYKEGKKGKKANFRQFASEVFSAGGHLSGILKSSAPAYGIKAAWNAGGQDYATYSKYELAAISVSPLSYASALKLDEQNPAQKGIDALEKAISKIASTIQKQISKRTDKMIFDVSRIGNITNTGFDITVSNAEITKLEGLSVTIPYADIHEMFIVDPETGNEVPLETDGHQDIVATVVATSNNKVTFQFDKQLSDYFKNLESLLKYLHNDDTNSGYFDDLNDMLKWMGGYEGSKGVVDQLGDKFIGYIEDFAPTFVSYMKPSDWLQPLAFVSDNNSWKPLSSAHKDSPRIITDTNPILYLTSRTGELLVPAYKKWIAVTNVFNEDGTAAPASVRDAANTGNINKVVPGSIRKASISLQKGYIYEISFQCVDYSGIVSAKQYYVKVK